MKVLLSLVLLGMSLAVAAQDQSAEKEAIKKTISILFDGMRKGDSTLLKTAFDKKAVFHSISASAAGETKLVSGETLQDFAKAIGTPHPDVWDERVSIEEIKINGNLASVWAPYKFYRGDKFSHCGIDSFQLMKTTAGWKIIYVVDTRLKDNCPE
ncbi:nuclear transport factor 2 family protein [Mucilaginibacter agri]|uniref:Lumazine-binding n=1 Tax=Mucilaginibacter agri TaxID=2695265 RepID=A0A966DQN1_9SPHI|nr:nuclear transport factor 2 family protein [Mucilaginibacter agri]NCD68168.1 hypothetical protein [Mucilaginibacter agri]